MNMNHRKRLISLDINRDGYTACTDQLITWAQQRQSSYVCVANVHMLVEAYQDKHFADMVNHADWVTADGMPLAIAMKLLYKSKQQRIAGMDLLPDLLILATQYEIPVFFYGGTQKMLDTTSQFCKKTYPDLRLAGLHSPPFRQLSPQEEDEIASEINKSSAGFVFVILGCPKQEKWMASMKGKVNACMIGVGGALPVLIGSQKRAPRWMQKTSLEWLYRLLQEPRRLFKRYAITNSIFIYLFLKAWLFKYSPK